MFGKITRLQVALASCCGGMVATAPIEEVSLEGLESFSSHELKDTVESIYAEIAEDMKSALTALPEYINSEVNKGLYGVMRSIYMNQGSIGTVEEAQQFGAVLDFNAEGGQVHPYAPHTLVFVTDTLLDKVLLQIVDEGRNQASLEKHCKRLISNLFVFAVFAEKQVGHASAMIEVANEPIPELDDEATIEVRETMESDIQETEMLVEGLESLFGGEASDRARRYTEGVLYANSIFLVEGNENFVESLKKGAMAIINKIKQAWASLAKLFAPKEVEEEVSKASELGDKAMEKIKGGASYTAEQAAKAAETAKKATAKAGSLGLTAGVGVIKLMLDKRKESKQKAYDNVCKELDKSAKELKDAKKKRDEIEKKMKDVVAGLEAMAKAMKGTDEHKKAKATADAAKEGLKDLKARHKAELESLKQMNKEATAELREKKAKFDFWKNLRSYPDRVMAAGMEVRGKTAET